MCVEDRAESQEWDGRTDPSRNAQLLPLSPSNEELMDAARRWMDIINHGSEWEEEGESEQDEDTKQNSASHPQKPPTHAL